MVTLSEESSSVNISTCQIGHSQGLIYQEKKAILATKRQLREDSEERTNER